MPVQLAPLTGALTNLPGMKAWLRSTAFPKAINTLFLLSVAWIFLSRHPIFFSSHLFKADLIPSKPSTPAFSFPNIAIYIGTCISLCRLRALAQHQPTPFDITDSPSQCLPIITDRVNLNTHHAPALLPTVRCRSCLSDRPGPNHPANMASSSAICGSIALFSWQTSARGAQGGSIEIPRRVKPPTAGQWWDPVPIILAPFNPASWRFSINSICAIRPPYHRAGAYIQITT